MRPNCLRNFCVPQRGDDAIGNEAVVEIVLRLIDYERGGRGPITTQQKKQEDG
jgi:hypothetical protein